MGGKRGKKKRPKYEWSAGKQLKYYRDRSVVVVENNSVIKLKCQQYTVQNKLLSNFSKC